MAPERGLLLLYLHVSNRCHDLPVIFRIGSVFYGLSVDPLLLQGMFWYIARGGGCVLGRVPIIGYPSGVDLSFRARELGVFLPGKILTWVVGQTDAYNLLILESFILAGVFMCYLGATSPKPGRRVPGGALDIVAAGSTR